MALSRRGGISENEKKLRQKVEGGIADFTIHGKYKDGTIYINPHSNQAYMRIFGHELNHFFKQSAPELYQSLKEVFDEAVKTAEGERSQEAQALWDEISRTYPEFKDSLDDLQEEYQGDLLGMMFTDRKFLGTLAEALERKKKGMGALLLEKMRDVLLHILRYLVGVGRYESVQMFNDVSRLYNDISDVLADYAANREAEEAGTETSQPGKSAWMVSMDTPATVVTLSSIPNVDSSDTAALREYLMAKFRGMEVIINYDGRLTKFTEGGIRATLKRRSKHREAYDISDELIRESYPVGYEKVDERHANHSQNLKGQFVYASLFKDIKGNPYVAVIKFNDSKATEYALFKDLSIQKMPPLYVGQTNSSSNVDSPADGNAITIQQVVDFASQKYKDEPLFSREMPPVKIVGEKSSDGRFLITPQEDAAYMDAVKRGDMETAQRMVDEAERRSGYSHDDSWRMDHRAPNKADGDVSLDNVKESGIVPDDYWEHPEWYQTGDFEKQAFWKVRQALELSEKRKAEGNERPVGIWVYRAVSKTKNKKESDFRNGDWVTPIREYAEQEGRENPEGYRIISRYALLRNLYWDGNSIAEFGYDDGENYTYADTRNNRKLLDPVTYDDEGNAIPLSQRFNKRKDDVRWSITERDESLKGITPEKLVKEIEKQIKEMVPKGYIKLRNEGEKQLIIKYAIDFFKKYAHKSIELSDGRHVFFWPDKRAFERLKDEEEPNLQAWAEYCIHAVTSSGEQIPGEEFKERWYNHTKAENIDRIEPIIREENAFRKLDNKNPLRDGVLFVGRTKEGTRMEIITHLDEYGNIQADLSEVTVLTTDSKKVKPQTRPLSEEVEAVAQHQAAGFSPSTTINVQETEEKSSDGGTQSDFSSQGDTENAPDFSSRGGKNLITRSGVESVFRKLGGDENPSVAAFASHNAALEALKGADGVTVWKTMAQPLRELAADLVSRQLAVPQLEEALPALEGIADIGDAFERYMDEGTAHDEATRDALSALKMLLLSVWQGNGQTMEVDDDVRTELDARLAAGECVNNMLPLADVRAALKTLEGTGVPGNGLPYDTLHLLQRVETQIRDRQEQHLKRTLNTLRRIWRGEAKELMAQDRDYQAWERIKAGGGLDYNMVKTLVGKEKTKLLRERGLLSKVADSVNAAEIDYNNLGESKTVNPYELFGSLGYADVFEMVDSLLKMATPTEFVKEYVNQNSEEWIQGQGWRLDEEALGNSQVIDGVRLLEKMLAEKTNWPLFSQSFKNDAYNRVHAMKVSDIISDNKALTDARMLVNDIVHAAGKKEADAGAIMDAVGALRLQLEILRQKATLKKDVGRIQRKMLKDAHAQKGTIHSFYHDALKELAYVFGVSKAEPDTSDGRQRAKKRRVKLTNTGFDIY